jgi:O-antigen/teichoic acid export membrane protein
MMNPFSGLSTVTGAAVCNVAIAAGLGVVMARFLGPAGQGALTLVTTIVALVIVTLTLGTGVSLRLRSGGKPAASDVRAFFGLSAALSPVAGALTIVVVYIAGQGILSTEELALSAVYGGTALAARQLCDLVQAYGRTIASIISLSVGSAVQLGIFAILVWIGKESVSSALACAILGALAQISFGLFSIRKHSLPWTPTIRSVIWRELVFVGSPSIGYSLGLLAIQRVDRLFLVAIAGPTAGGIYAVAATIAETARITSSAVGQLLFVRVAEARTITAEVTRLYRRAILLQIVALAALAIGAPLIVPIFFGPAFAPAVAPVRGLLVAEFFMGLALMDSRMIMGLGHLKEMGTVTVGAVLVALVLYPALISREATNGAVLATVLIYAGFAVATLARRIQHTLRPVHV